MTPAWKSWDLDGSSVLDWHPLECAMCGRGEGRIYLDHCHDTGLCRGYLCHQCNGNEAASDAPEWQAWRSWDNPARALNSVEPYEFGWGLPTPLRPTSPLEHFAPSEREAWWSEQRAAAEAGEDWPTPIVESAAIRERREAAQDAMRAAVMAIPGAT